MSDRELNYPGRVDCPPGCVMGPDLKGRLWESLGAMYDPEADRTTVTVRQYEEGA